MCFYPTVVTLMTAGVKRWPTWGGGLTPCRQAWAPLPPPCPRVIAAGTPPPPAALSLTPPCYISLGSLSTWGRPPIVCHRPIPSQTAACWSHHQEMGKEKGGGLMGAGGPGSGVVTVASLYLTCFYPHPLLDDPSG